MNKKILVFCSIVFILTVLSYMNIFANTILKEWVVNEMPLGEIESWDGLEMIPGTGNLTVENTEKRYGDLIFTKYINTGGAANANLAFIPNKRAIKFTTDKPCVMRLYVCDTSTVANQTLVISRKNEILLERETIRSVFKIDLVLPEADTYYIYSKQGGIGVCLIQLEELLKGDLNNNGMIDEGDLRTFIRVLNGEEDLYGYERLLADINSDNAINETDKELLEEKFNEIYGYIPLYFSEKAWNINDIPYGTFNSYDGLYSLLEGQLTVENCSKSYDGKTFLHYIKTNGGARAVNGLPTERAIKINVDAPCKLSVYLMSGSSVAENPIACISREGEVISEFSIQKSIDKVDVVLREADTYYIYSTDNSGSMNVYAIELTPTPLGDINGNFQYDYEDLKLITEYINGNGDLNNIQKIKADVNKDGSINDTDRTLILNLISQNYISEVFSNKEWDFKGADTETVYEYDGLEIIPAPKASDVQAKIVTASNKYYYDTDFTKALFFNGTGSISKRAVKISVSEPTLLTFYAYSNSSSVNVNYACVANKSVILDKFDLDEKEPYCSVVKCRVYLNSADTYYIYCSNGSMGLCNICLYQVEVGDLSADKEITFDDYNILYDYISDGKNNPLSDWQMKCADMDGNGSVNDDDLEKLLLEVKSNTEYYNKCYSEKQWNFSDIYSSYFTSQGSINVKTEDEDLIFYPAGTSEDMPYFERLIKEVGKYQFNYAYNTNGKSIPYKRSVGFKVNAPCILGVYLRSASTSDIQQKLCLYFNSQTIDEVEFLNSLEQPTSGVQYVSMYIDKPGEYQLYSPNGAVYYYMIELTKSYSNIDTMYETEKTAAFTEIGTEEVFFTCEDLKSVSNYIYRVDYDSSVLNVTEIGLYNDRKAASGTNIYVDKDISILERGSGYVIFKINEDVKNYTGLLTSIKFKVSKAVSTNIKFSVLRKNGEV